MKVIITGAGIIGLSCAWRLAAAGATVHILDPRGPGHGATLAALGALWPAAPLARGPLQTLHRQSLWQFEGFATAIGEQSGKPISFRRLGRIEILNSPKAVARAREEALAAQKEWPQFAATAHTMEVMDWAAAKKLNPGLAPFPHGAMLCRATGQVNVPELVTSLVAACRAAGATFHESAAAGSLLQTGDRITGIQTTAGPMHADAVLVTAGVWTPQISPLLAINAPITPAKGQGLAVPMPSPRPISSIVKSGKIYLIPWDNEILIGSTTEPDAGFDESPTESARTKLLAGAIEMLPALVGTSVLRHWAGLRPGTEDNLPIMGPIPTNPGLYVCSGHYKTGLGLAPAVSGLMTKAILENVVPLELAPFLPHCPPLTETPSPVNP